MGTIIKRTSTQRMPTCIIQRWQKYRKFAALNATTEAVVDTSTKSISQGGNMTLDTVAIALDPKLKQIRELNQKINLSGIAFLWVSKLYRSYCDD